MAIPVQFEDYFNIVTKNLQRMDGYLIPDWFLDQMTMIKGEKKMFLWIVEDSVSVPLKGAPEIKIPLPMFSL